MIPRRKTFVCGLLAALIALSAAPAAATGTVQVHQHDGSEKTYKHVTIKANDSNLAVTSSDGAGTLVVGKSACSEIGSLIRCLPYDAVLSQYGNTYHITVTAGTLWLNPGSATKTIQSSGKAVPARGVILSMRTKAGTSVYLTGTMDEVQK